MHPTIKEIILALDAEIKELKKGHSGRTISVFDGVIVQESSNSYIYQFVVDNVFSTMDDTPAEIEVNGKNYRCYIVTIEGQNVVLSLDENLGNKIPSAKLKINTWYLLEELKRKFEESADDSKKFTSSLKLFSGETSPIHLNIYLLETDNFFIGNELDESQKEAVKASLFNSFCIIWGPPGTGKTKTIAKLIEGHIKLGRRVLLVSHSNNAVDEAMLRIGEKFRNSSIYEEGKLVRFGNIKPEYLQKIKEENLDLIRFDEIFKKKSENLLSEKSKLTGELTTLNTKLEKAREAKNLYNFIKNIDYKINATEKILNEKTQTLSYLNEQIEKLLEVRAELQNRLLKANESNALKRLFLGLNPEAIKARLEKLEEEIMSKRQQERELENGIASLKAELSTLQIKKSESQKYMEDSLKNFSVSIQEIDSYTENLKSKIEALKSKILDIQKALDEMQLGILGEALVVGTTLTMTYIAKVFETLSFDVLVVDEVSMAPQPMLFWAASKASTAITIVGDFMQLPPISVSKNEFTLKWLAKSIFDTLGINDFKRAIYDTRIKLLKTQYRMHPSISKISNKFIYQEVINDRKTDYKEVEDKISGNKPVILVDTSSANPWASQAFSGGRFNLYNALLCVNLAESILSSLDNNQRVGIVTPYRHQANLILRIAKDKGIESRVRVGVIHNFQGSEEEVIIFDTVEGVGAKKWSMLNEYNNNEEAKKLINVAITLAKSKLYIVANVEYLERGFPKDELIREIINHVKSYGLVINSSEIIKNWRAEDFDKSANLIYRGASQSIKGSLLYNQYEFWQSFIEDLKNAKDRVIVLSPFVSIGGTSKLLNLFISLINRGVKIFVITRPPAKQASLAEQSKESIEKLIQVGVNVSFWSEMHQKISIIDDQILWEGSLNILSHNYTEEQMRRFEGKNTIEQVYDNLNLRDFFLSQNDDKYCPKCLSKGIKSLVTLKSGKFGYFYACTNPNCDWISPFKNGIPSVRDNETSSKLYSNALSQHHSQNEEWETSICYWSLKEKPGYKYSTKRNA